MPLIDFSVPFWLINYYHIIGVISMILNSIGLYLLMFQNNKLDKIKYYMLAYQIACFLTDVHLTLLMQPVPLYPIFGGFTVGIASEWFNITTHHLMMLIILFVVLQLELLNLSFQHKHQTLAKVLIVRVIPDWFVNFLYGVCVACPIGACAWFQLVRLNKQEQWDVIRKKHAQYLQNFQALPYLFDVYINTPWFILLMVVTIIGGFVVLFFFLFFMIDIFQMMGKVKFKISAVRYKQHQEAIQKLMVQFAMSFFCVVPPCCLCIIIILELNNAQLLTELCICWFAMHSSANMISLMVFFPPYRNFILRQLRVNPAISRIFDKSSNVVLPTLPIPQPERSIQSNTIAVR